ncbi:MAG: hypothetical protein ACFB5Z_19360 [Elainellaceae cyanobacterium]
MTYHSRHGRAATPSPDSLRSQLIIEPAGRLNELNTPDANLSDHLNDDDTLLHIIIGPLYAVNSCRHELHLRGYAEPNDWSNPMKMLNTAAVMRSQHPNDVMRVLRKRVRPTQQP